MPTSQSLPEYTVRTCGDHFHVTITRKDWVEKRWPAVIQKEYRDLARWREGTKNLYIRGYHTHNYTPFKVSKALRGEFYMLRRMDASEAEAYCEECVGDGIIPNKKLHEVDWKLYRLSDISDQPCSSDLAGNDGLRDDFARRQERLQHEREARSAADAEREPPPPYGA